MLEWIVPSLENEELPVIYSVLIFCAGFILGGLVFLLVGFTIGRQVRDGEDHFLPPAKR